MILNCVTKNPRWEMDSKTINASNFVIQGRRVRVVVDGGAIYVLFKVGGQVAVLKGDGGAYTIDAKGRCSCPGYKHRTTCKHVAWGGTEL